jgi:hypothetical protein
MKNRENEGQILNRGEDNSTIKFINDNLDTTYGGTIADELEIDEVPRREEEKPPGRPITFFLGLGTLLLGLFIVLGSLVHNHAQVWVTETSHMVYGPYDWAAAIVGSVVFLVGILFLLFSKVAKAPT